MQFVPHHFYLPFSATLLVAINEIKKSAQQHGLSFRDYGMFNTNLCVFSLCYNKFTPDTNRNCAVIQSRDPSTNVVLLEDTAAVLGVIMASSCMGLTSLTGKHRDTHSVHMLPRNSCRKLFAESTSSLEIVELMV